MIDREPLEVRVLTALTAGASAPEAVAAQVAEPAATVAALLERGVTEGLLQRTQLGGGPAYSLTPKGLETVAVWQGVSGAVDGHGHVDYGAAARMVMEQYEAARDVAAEDALREQAGWPADDATRDRVSAALNDAYARGALTKEQLDTRTSTALTATTMGELRAAGDGVIELAPVLPTGIGPVRTSPGGATLSVNPALKEIRWRYAGCSVGVDVLGVILLSVQPLLGVAVLVAGIALGLWTLRPLLRTGTTRVRTR